MRVGLFLIGDELLLGKRQDKHLARVVEMLHARGMQLHWVEMLPDDTHGIAEAIVRRRGDLVLSCGGIGATPDDCTRQAAALAFDRPLDRHPEAEGFIVEQYGQRAYPNRVLMADFPQGAGLIPNPVNRVAGFFMEDQHFVPGFPNMAWPMLEWVLDSRYSALHRTDPDVEYSMRAIGSASEGDLLQIMQALLQKFEPVKLSCLPFRGSQNQPRHIEFGVRGARENAEAAYHWLWAALKSRKELKLEALHAPPTSSA